MLKLQNIEVRHRPPSLQGIHHILHIERLEDFKQGRLYLSWGPFRLTSAPLPVREFWFSALLMRKPSFLLFKESTLLNIPHLFFFIRSHFVRKQAIHKLILVKVLFGVCTNSFFALGALFKQGAVLQGDGAELNFVAVLLSLSYILAVIVEQAVV